MNQPSGLQPKKGCLSPKLTWAGQGRAGRRDEGMGGFSPVALTKLQGVCVLGGKDTGEGVLVGG